MGHFSSYPDPRALIPLIEVLKDDNVEVREEAVSVLGRFSDSRVVPALLGVLQNPAEDARVRISAAWHLRFAGDARAFVPAVAILSDARERPSVRAAVARVLAELHNRQSFEPAMVILGNAQEAPEVRAAAAELLAELQDPRASGLLNEIATSDAPRELRFWAAVGTARIADGEVDDSRIVAAIQEYSWNVDGADMHGDMKSMFLIVGAVITVCLIQGCRRRRNAA